MQRPRLLHTMQAPSNHISSKAYRIGQGSLKSTMIWNHSLLSLQARPCMQDMLPSAPRKSLQIAICHALSSIEPSVLHRAHISTIAHICSIKLITLSSRECNKSIQQAAGALLGSTTSTLHLKISHKPRLRIENRDSAQAETRLLTPARIRRLAKIGMPLNARIRQPQQEQALQVFASMHHQRAHQTQRRFASSTTT